MNFTSRLACGTALLFSVLISGCNILPTTRRLPLPKVPPVVQTLTPKELVDQVNQRWDALNSLTATVEIYATELKTAQGLEKDFPSCRGYILMRKPKMLRVFGTEFGVPIFNMASNGQRFTLVLPRSNTAIEGSDTLTEKSSNPLENLRPDFFLDAIALRGIDSGEDFMVTNDTETVEDASKKHLLSIPEYVLNIMRPKSGQEKLPVRTITIHRNDLLPYDQTIYDDKGSPETLIYYSNYMNFSAGMYPSKVVIRRPQEGIQLVLNVERVEKNVKLNDSQFEVKIPEDAKVRQLR